MSEWPGDHPSWGLQARLTPERRTMAANQTLDRGFVAFGAAPADSWRPTRRVYEHANMHVESLQTRAQPDLQRKLYPHGLRTTAAEPFAGPDWGIGGSFQQGKKLVEPPPALDYCRAQRRHYPQQPAISPHFTIEDVLNRKGHVMRDGQRVALARSGTFGIEQQVGTKRRVPMRLELREGEIIPAGSQYIEHVVYSKGYFNQEGITPSLVLGRKRYAPSAQNGQQLRERHKALSFRERNAIDMTRAEAELVSTLELPYDEEACSPRAPPEPVEVAPLPPPVPVKRAAKKK